MVKSRVGVAVLMLAQAVLHICFATTVLYVVLEDQRSLTINDYTVISLFFLVECSAVVNCLIVLWKWDCQVPTKSVKRQPVS